MKNLIVFISFLFFFSCDDSKPVVQETTPEEHGSEMFHDAMIKKANLKLYRIENEGVRFDGIEYTKTVDRISQNAYYVFDDASCADIPTDSTKAKEYVYSTHLKYDGEKMIIVVCPLRIEELDHNTTNGGGNGISISNVSGYDFAAGKLGCIYYLQHDLENKGTEKEYRKLKIYEDTVPSVNRFYIEAACFFHPNSCQLTNLSSRLYTSTIDGFTDIEKHLQKAKTAGVVNIGIESIYDIDHSNIVINKYELKGLKNHE